MALTYLEISEEQFFKMTLAQVQRALFSYSERKEAEFKRQKWLIWHAEALKRQRRLMPLRKFLRGAPSGTQVLEGEELERRRREHDEIASRAIIRKK